MKSLKLNELPFVVSFNYDRQYMMERQHAHRPLPPSLYVACVELRLFGSSRITRGNSRNLIMGRSERGRVVVVDCASPRRRTSRARTLMGRGGTGVSYKALRGRGSPPQYKSDDPSAVSP